MKNWCFCMLKTAEFVSFELFCLNRANGHVGATSTYKVYQFYDSCKEDTVIVQVHVGRRHISDRSVRVQNGQIYGPIFDNGFTHVTGDLACAACMDMFKLDTCFV